MRRREWERPEIVAASALPDALGDCVGGSTETVGVGGGCFNGQITAQNGDQGGHACCTGGAPLQPPSP